MYFLRECVSTLRHLYGYATAGNQCILLTIWNEYAEVLCVVSKRRSLWTNDCHWNVKRSTRWVVNVCGRTTYADRAAVSKLDLKHRQRRPPAHLRPLTQSTIAVSSLSFVILYSYSLRLLNCSRSFNADYFLIKA